MRCRLSWLTNSVLVYEPKREGRGGEVRGFSQWVQLYKVSQINFGDLTSAYLQINRTKINVLNINVLQINGSLHQQKFGGALCRSMSPNFNVTNINVLHINCSLLQPWVVEVQSTVAVPKALQINGSIHQWKLVYFSKATLEYPPESEFLYLFNWFLVFEVLLTSLKSDI